jgi:hypothetical protein
MNEIIRLDLDVKCNFLLRYFVCNNLLRSYNFLVVHYDIYFFLLKKKRKRKRKKKLMFSLYFQAALTIYIVFS